MISWFVPIRRRNRHGPLLATLWALPANRSISLVTVNSDLARPPIGRRIVFSKMCRNRAAVEIGAAIGAMLTHDPLFPQDSADRFQPVVRRPLTNTDMLAAADRFH